MTDHWDFYFCNVDDKPASMFVDLGASELAPVESLPNMAYLRLFMNNPREDGLSSSEEFEALSNIEDKIKVLENNSCAFVGRCTTNSYRDFVFYVSKTDNWDVAVGGVMNEFPAYKFETGWRPDAEWDTYLKYLYPSERDMQKIENSKVCEALERHGDKLMEDREIDHWINFQAAEHRDTFIQKALEQGFHVRDSYDPEDDSDSYTVQLWRVDHPSYHQINEVALSLFDLAREHNGSYDGWETYVIT